MSFARLKDYRQSITRCDRILEVEPNEFRAYFRKGIGFKSLCEYHNATQAFQKGKIIAETFDQSDAVKDFDKEIKGVEVLVQAYHKKEKKIFANLFK